MKEFEILIETINPCGGEGHAKKEIVEDTVCFYKINFRRNHICMNMKSLLKK